VAEGVFTENGHFVNIPDIAKHKAAEFWQERISVLLLDAHKINDEIVGNMRTWIHSGFSVDNSVRIEKGDKAGMQRLVEYISRCPFSLTRMISQAEDGKILYRASHPNCIPFPISGGATLLKGIPRNFEVYNPLDFLAEVTQHIPKIRGSIRFAITATTPIRKGACEGRVRRKYLWFLVYRNRTRLIVANAD
jgi:hypothetical protein